MFSNRFIVISDFGGERQFHRFDSDRLSEAASEVEETVKLGGDVKVIDNQNGQTLVDVSGRGRIRARDFAAVKAHQELLLKAA